MASTDYITKKLAGELAQYGRGVMSVLYPSEIEVYLMAMELTDSKGVTQQYFVFPVMPNSISKVEQNRTNIKKSSSGTTVIGSSSHSPSEINIKGDFGRSFKILTSPTGEGSFSFGIFKSKGKDQLNVTTPTLDPNVKSGFGCIKIMQSMVNLSGKLDAYSKPNRLYFYNMALGESYLVAVMPGGLTLSQSYDKNMIWGYNLTMHILANLEDLKSSEDAQKSLKSILAASVIQNSANILVGEVKNLL